MRAISAKIDSLENELEKRAPTPTEKIEMRSLDSYPYNIKLSDLGLPFPTFIFGSIPGYKTSSDEEIIFL